MGFSFGWVVGAKIFSCFCFSLMNIFKKQISLPVFHLLFLEQLGFFCLLLCFRPKIPWNLLTHKEYLLRVLLGSLGSFCWLLGLKNTSILFMVFTAFLGPFVTIGASRLLLKESLGFYGYGAIFLGILSGLSLHFSYIHHNESLWSWLLIFGPLATVCFSLCSVFSKKLMTKGSELGISALLSFGSMMIYLVIFMTWCLWECFGPPGLSFGDILWKPYGYSWGGFSFVGLLCCHLGGNLLLLWSLKQSHLLWLLPLGTFRLVFSSLLAYVIFSEVPPKFFPFTLGFMVLGLWFLHEEKKRHISSKNP